MAARVEARGVALVRAEWNAPFVSEPAEIPGGHFEDRVDVSSDSYSLINEGRFQPFYFA